MNNKDTLFFINIENINCDNFYALQRELIDYFDWEHEPPNHLTSYWSWQKMIFLDKETKKLRVIGENSILYGLHVPNHHPELIEEIKNSKDYVEIVIEEILNPEKITEVIKNFFGESEKTASNTGMYSYTWVPPTPPYDWTTSYTIPDEDASVNINSSGTISPDEL